MKSLTAENILITILALMVIGLTAGCGSGEPDVIGRYRGIIPAADGPGIDMQIELLEDSTYTQRLDYLERNVSFSDSGRWNVIPDVSEGSKRYLLQLRPAYGNGNSPATLLLIKSHKALELLDASGQQINSGLNYTLRRKL